MFPADTPVRHGWAWLGDKWSRSPRDSIGAADLWLIEEWQASRRPFVVARAGETQMIRLGLATRDKQRIGFEVDRQEIARFAPPLALCDAIDAAPIAWREPLGGIAEDAIHHGLDVYVYGSLAWTYRSNLMFLRPDSDVDLILVPRHSSLAELHMFVRALVDRVETPRLDGELLTPAGAVGWREFAKQPDTLLVKTALGPVIKSRVDFEDAIVASLQ